MPTKALVFDRCTGSSAIINRSAFAFWMESEAGPTGLLVQTLEVYVR